MKFEKYNLTPSAKKSLINAQKIADYYGHLKTTELHLFLSILGFDNINIEKGLESYGIDKKSLIQYFESKISEYKENARKRKIYSKEVYEVLDKAKEYSEKSNMNYVGIDHMFICALSVDMVFFEFRNLNIDHMKLIQCIQENFSSLNDGKEKVSANSQKSEPVDIEEEIENWCIDLNKKAIMENSFDFFGREKELKRCYEVLLRKNKKNVILVGEAGVGKSCLVKGLVKGIIEKTAPDLFLDKKIYLLNTSSIVAGSIYRGQMEEKIEKIIKFFSDRPNYILFIDEIHTIIGAGNSEGGLDFANILKPALAEDKISCIGATTKEEHDRFFKKESALNRRFEKVEVVEPTKEETFDLLKNTKEFYENFHLVDYPDECLWLIVDLCDQYMTNRRFPDKAFDILDESGARTKIKNISRPEEAKELEKKLENFENTKSKEFSKMLEKYQKILKDWSDSLADAKFSIDKDVIYDIFAEILETSRENLENKSSIVVPGKIGF